MFRFLIIYDSFREFTVFKIFNFREICFFFVSSFFTFLLNNREMKWKSRCTCQKNSIFHTTTFSSERMKATINRFVILFALRKWRKELEMRKIKWNFFIFFFQRLFLTKFVLQFLKINILRIFFRLNFFFTKFFLLHQFFSAIKANDFNFSWSTNHWTQFQNFYSQIWRQRFVSHIYKIKKVLSANYFNFDTSMIKFHFDKIFNQKRTIRSKSINFDESNLCEIEIHTITNHYSLRLEENIAIKKSCDVIKLCNTIFQKLFVR